MPPVTADHLIWHRTLGALINAVDKPNFWYVLIRYLRDAVHFESWVVLCFSRDARPEVLAESPGANGGEDELFKDYLNGFYLLDPFYLAFIDDPRAGLVRLDDVAPDHFEAEEYFQRYFQLNVVKDEIHFNLLLEDQRELALLLGSSVRFSVEEMQLFMSITPWIVALMRQRLRFEVSLAAAPARRPSAPHDVDGADEVADNKQPTLALGLTARELEILHLLLSGHSSKGIAQHLRISPETVKAHRRHIYTKLGVRSHAELFAMLIRENALPFGGGQLQP